MGVTAFRQVNNDSDHTITVYNHEHHSDSVTLNPHSKAGIEMWIPWCVSQVDFNYGHYITVDQPTNSPVPVPQHLYAIWQKDNTVCYSTDAQYHNPGMPIPGVCAINGDRILTINSDLSITVTHV